MREKLIKKMQEEKIIAIVRGIEKSKALSAVAALYQAGIKFFEVTFNTKGATEIIAELSAMYGADMYIGAGTVLDAQSVIAAKQAGARFILSPDTDEAVIKTTRELGLVSVPGALSATEVRMAQKFGGDIIKIFPAGSMGPTYIKDLLGPLDNSQFMAVGGVGLNNIKAFLDAGVVACGIGSTLLDKKLIGENDMDSLRELGKKFVQVIRTTNT